MKRFLTFLLIFSFIFCFYIPCYADDNTTIDTVDLPFEAYAYHSGGSDNVTDLVNVSTVTSSVFKGMLKFEFPLSTDYNYTRTQAALQLLDDYDFNSNHEYTVSFNYGFNISLPLILEVGLYFYNAKGEIIKVQQIADIEHVKTDSQKVHNLNVSFKPDINDLGSGYTTKMIIQFYQTGYNSSSIYQVFYISQQISLIDKDDNSNWFQKIINKITELWETVKTIPDKISGKINELGASISLIITNLKNNLIEGIKSLFTPSDNFFEVKLDELQFFFDNKFGVFALPFTLIFEVLQLYNNVGNGSGILHLKEFKIDDNIFWSARDINLKQLINDFSIALYNDCGIDLYQIYLAFIDVILLFAFVRLVKNKYDKMLGNGSFDIPQDIMNEKGKVSNVEKGGVSK